MQRTARSSLRSIAIAGVAGIAIGVPIEAAWAVYGTHDLWYHGIGSNNGDGVIHPFNSSTDGAARSSCIGFLDTIGHSNVDCHIAQHNHVGGPNSSGDVGTRFEASSSGHHESSQTGMAHHHQSNN